MIFNGENKILRVQDMGTWLVRQGKIIPALFGGVDSRARLGGYMLQTTTDHNGNRILFKMNNAGKMEKVTYAHGKIKTVMKGVKSSSLPLFS